MTKKHIMIVSVVLFFLLGVSVTFNVMFIKTLSELRGTIELVREGNELLTATNNALKKQFIPMTKDISSLSRKLSELESKYKLLKRFFDETSQKLLDSKKQLLEEAKSYASLMRDKAVAEIDLAKERAVVKALRKEIIALKKGGDACE